MLQGGAIYPPVHSLARGARELMVATARGCAGAFTVTAVRPWCNSVALVAPYLCCGTPPPHRWRAGRLIA